MARVDTRRETEGDPPAVKNPVEARAGLISGHVVTVLIVGTILSIALLALAWIIFRA